VPNQASHRLEPAQQRMPFQSRPGKASTRHLFRKDTPAADKERTAPAQKGRFNSRCAVSCAEESDFAPDVRVNGPAAGARQHAPTLLPATNITSVAPAAVYQSFVSLHLLVLRLCLHRRKKVDILALENIWLR